MQNEHSLITAMPGPNFPFLGPKGDQNNKCQGLRMKNASNVETSAYLRVGTGIFHKISPTQN